MRRFHGQKHCGATDLFGNPVEVSVGGYQTTDGAVNDAAITINGDITVDAANADKLIIDLRTAVEEMGALTDATDEMGRRSA